MNASEPRPGGRRLHAVVLGAIGVAILAGLFAKFPWDRVAAGIASVPAMALALALVFEGSTILLKAVRWALLLGRAPGAARIYLIGQAVNQVAPLGTGEATRVYVGRVRSGIPVKSTLTAIVVERVADTGFLVAVALLAAAVALFPAASWPVLAVPAGLLGLAVLVLARPSLLGRLGELGRRISRLPLDRPLREVQGAVEALRGRRTALGSVGVLTPAAWVFEAAVLAVLLDSVGVPAPFLTVLLFTCVSELVGAFSFLPGGLGAREAVIVLLFPAEFGVQVFAAALLFRLVAASSLAAGALAGLVTYPRKNPAGA